MAPRVVPGAIYTIGHSNRPSADFLEMLRSVRIERVVDVRKMPGSRANPQYDAAALRAALETEGIAYEYLPALGGLRAKSASVPPEVNGAWSNRSFHHYADHAHTPAFRTGLEELIARAGLERCAIMCAEAVWWRCHRRIIADHLLARDVPVVHILGATRHDPANLTPFAAIGLDGSILYPAPV